MKVEAAGVEGANMEPSVRVRSPTDDNEVAVANSSGSTRTSTVPNLGTALADAVLAGDLVTARRLALELRESCTSRDGEADPQLGQVGGRPGD